LNTKSFARFGAGKRRLHQRPRQDDEAAWSEMCVRLCRKMTEQISPNVQDDSVKNSQGRPIVGGELFRKYLNRVSNSCCPISRGRGYRKSSSSHNCWTSYG